MLGYVLGITLVLTALSPLVFTDAFADSFVVNFDKQFYDVDDSLTISGEVTEIGMPIIAMSIYDPDGKILSANNLEISPEKTFTKTILLNPPFYEKIGEYLIKLDYGKVSEKHYFVIEGESSDSEILIESSDDPEIILLYTEQKQYTDKDVIKITGLVSVLDSPSVLIGIYDPFGMPAGFYFGTIDSNLEFTTSFLAKDGVNFRVDGIYSIKAHYAETETISFFEYSKDSQITIEEPVVKEPVVKEPVVKEPVVKEPVVKEPVVKEPVVKEPVVKEP
ncbi:MAG: tetratricopeptide repeat protein, partial [Nitrosopumilus sp.]|nr:tetratricopeptide repeat protein [Nitrosopumilus sp.]